MKLWYSYDRLFLSVVDWIVIRYISLHPGYFEALYVFIPLNMRLQMK